jgi:hypothetical protein
MSPGGTSSLLDFRLHDGSSRNLDPVQIRGRLIDAVNS